MELSFEEKRARLGLNVTYYRRARNIAQMQLADKVGVSSCYISRIECGLKTVSLRMRMKMADALETKEAALINFWKRSVD